MSEVIRIPKPLPSDIEVADYVIRVHNSMGGGYMCPECQKINTCWPKETHWFKKDADTYRIEQKVECEYCGHVSVVFWTQKFHRGSK